MKVSDAARETSPTYPQSITRRPSYLVSKSSISRLVRLPIISSILSCISNIDRLRTSLPLRSILPHDIGSRAGCAGAEGIGSATAVVSTVGSVEEFEGRPTYAAYIVPKAMMIAARTAPRSPVRAWCSCINLSIYPTPGNPSVPCYPISWIEPRSNLDLSHTAGPFPEQ